MKYIQTSSQNFITKMNEMGEVLKTFSSELNERQNSTFQLITKFIDESVQTLPKIENNDNPVNKAMVNYTETYGKIINNWGKKIQANKKGTEFMHKHEKHLVVMVFGAVKAGKSSLGNFFAGKDFLKTDYPNIYKELPITIFETEDTKRNHGGIQIDESTGRQWFTEGYTDTTGAIQYFTISGLRWLDSPGTGAVEKATDVQDGRSMDEMVREYIPFADLCIFLQNSSEPGLQSDMKYIKELHKENQTALVVITKSDINEEDEDEEGNLVQVWMPKDATTRKLQEEHICNQIKESCPHVAPEKYSALSISTKLAKDALKEGNDEKFQQSNLDKLMEAITAKTSSNIVALKSRKPKQNLNAFIDNIIEEVDSQDTITALNDYLNSTLNEIRKQQKHIDEEKKIIISNIQTTVSNILRNELTTLANQVDSSGTDISGEHLNTIISQKISPYLNKEINNSIREIIDGYQEQNLSQLTRLVAEDQGIKKEIKILRETYTGTDYVEREPSGFWEKTRSIFGKKYYDSYKTTRTLTSRVDLGTNIADFLKDVLPDIREKLNQHIITNLDNIKNNYFAPQEAYILTAIKNLEHLKSELLKYKYNLEE